MGKVFFSGSIKESNIIQIDRSQPLTPNFIGNGWTIWRGPANGNGLRGKDDQDERSLALTKLDLTKVQFETTLKKNENCVGGKERHNRLRKMGYIRLDIKIRQTLFENETLIPESWKDNINGYCRYIFFDGTFLRNPDGQRCVPYMCWRNGEWILSDRWIDMDFGVGDPSAILAI